MNNVLAQNVSELDILDALKYIENKYGKTIAEFVEKIYRLETRHFKSYLFKQTYGAGLLYNEKTKYLGEPFCLWILERESGNIIVSPNTLGAKRFCYVKFKSLLQAFDYLARYITKNGNELENIYNRIKRYGGGEKYLEKVLNIKNIYVK
jgi:hypothetical protein